MADELFELLAARLHEAELIMSDYGEHTRESSRFCRRCRLRVELLIPEVRAYIDSYKGALG